MQNNRTTVEQLLNRPILAIVLGSGQRCEPPNSQLVTQIPYSELEGLPTVTVPGHQGQLAIYALPDAAGRSCQVLVFRGRFHLYEGHDIPTVQSLVRLIRAWGVSHLLLTNSAGGIREDLAVGDLLHIQAVQNYQLAGGPRGLLENLNAPSLPIDTPFSEQLRERAALATGVYAAMLGPNYETCSEIQLLRAQGGAAVGMSTYLELRYALEQGLNVAACSVITNSWAQTADRDNPSHQEVLRNSQRAQDKLDRVFDLAWKLALETDPLHAQRP